MAKPIKIENKTQVYKWKFRYCVGRDENYKQKWATATIDRPTDKDGNYLTPKQEEKEVQRLYLEWEREQKERYQRNPDTRAKGKTPFDSFVKYHWQQDYVSKLKDYTQQSYAVSITPALAFFKDKNISSIDEEDIIRFVGYLRQRRKPDGKLYSASSITHQYATFTSVMSYAERLKYIDTNPCLQIKGREIPKPSQPKSEAMSQAELQEVLKALKTEPLYWRTLIDFLANTGLRRGEALALTWADIPTEPNTAGKYPILISKNATHTAKHGTNIGSTKTDRERTVYITDAVYEELQRLKAERQAMFHIKDNTYIWCRSKDVNTPIVPQEATKWYSNFLQKHNLPKSHLHMLRHTLATLMLHNHMSIADAKQLLGHGSIHTTLTFYVGAIQENLENTADIVGDMISNRGEA